LALASPPVIDLVIARIKILCSAREANHGIAGAKVLTVGAGSGDLATCLDFATGLGGQRRGRARRTA
jgi:hypothetical protein